MDVSSLRAHIESKIGEHEIDILPFPHMIIHDFFPESVWRQITERNLFRTNRGKEWFTKDQLNALRSSSPYDHRLQINLCADADYEASRGDREFWNMMGDAFMSDEWFPRLIYQKLPQYFEFRFGELVREPDFFSKFRKEFFLQRHEPTYYIGPHTDIPTRVFTCIFSFAEVNGYEEFGTRLMRHKDPHIRCKGMQHYTNWEEFETVKLAEYRPNNFLLFFKTPQSWHAVQTITPDVPNERYGMQYQFYEPDKGLFKYMS
jgi:hypothetical protein